MPLFSSGRAFDGQLKLDAATMCRRSNNRAGDRQRDFCQRKLDTVRQMALGVNMAVDECGIQFENRLWNCNTTSKKSVARLLKMGEFSMCVPTLFELLCLVIQLLEIELISSLLVTRVIHSCMKT
jgi:hypothetical protein